MKGSPVPELRPNHTQTHNRVHWGRTIGTTGKGPMGRDCETEAEKGQTKTGTNEGRQSIKAQRT